jgi:hypothetical protein
MAYCDACGFYIESGDCEMCETHAARGGTDDERERREATRRHVSTWWIPIAATPFLLVGTYSIAVTQGTFPNLIHSMVLALYVYALLADLRYIHAERTGWTPRILVWMGLAFANVLALGALTFVLTPYYLHKRLRTSPLKNSR